MNRDMLVSSHLYVTHCEKNLTFNLPKARYRDEIIKADTCLKCLLRNEAKTGKRSLLLNFIFMTSKRFYA